jgi:hypothetical protein
MEDEQDASDGGRRRHTEVRHQVDLHVHGDRDSAILQEIRQGMGVLLKQGRIQMGKLEDLRAELVEINAATSRQAAASTEIATDVDALLARPVGEPLTDEDIAHLRAIKEAATGQAAFLEAVAAKYTPEAPPA